MLQISHFYCYVVNSHNIVLIDSINGDYGQSLNDIFVTNDAKWINVTHDNFQPYILPERIVLIGTSEKGLRIH